MRRRRGCQPRSDEFGKGAGIEERGASSENIEFRSQELGVRKANYERGTLNHGEPRISRTSTDGIGSALSTLNFQHSTFYGYAAVMSDE